jgi:UPF0271 protein
MSERPATAPVPAAGLLPRIDLNADAGEGFDSDELFAALSTISIACGAHAGDEATIRAALAGAHDCGLAAGAHPGYPDREHFGRVETGLPAGAIAATVLRQVGQLAALALESGLRLTHVKPHGALYHRVARDPEAARAFVSAVSALDEELAIVGFPGSELLAAAAAAGLTPVAEGFADRGYAGDGTLLARGERGALLSGKSAAAQAAELARRGVKTLCVHSDSPGAAATARAVRRALEEAGLAVVPFADSSRVHPIPTLYVVGAALVERRRVLLTRRSPRMTMPGKWEFPGGKVESGEAPEAALAREVAEELGLAIEVGERLGRGTSLHAGRRIVLDVFLVRRMGGELRLTQHEEHGWFAAAEAIALDWPEADLPILPALAARLRD